MNLISHERIDALRRFTPLRMTQPDPTPTKDISPKRKTEHTGSSGYTKKQRKHGDILEAANRLWSENIKDATKDEKEIRVNRLIKTIEGHFGDIAVKHDGARVVQICIKYGTVAQKQAIASELKGKYIELCRNAYGHHVVLKLLAYGDKTVEEIVFSEIASDCKTLSLHSHGCKIIDYVWREVADEKRKEKMVRPFFGKRFLILEGESSLEDAFQRDPTDKLRKMVVRILLEFMQKAFEKELCGMGIVHRLISVYLKFAEDVEVSQIIESDLKKVPLALLQTEEGAKVLLTVLLKSNAKQSKHIIKSMKGKIADIARDPNGWFVLAMALLTVDDTVLLRKSVLSELFEHMDVLLMDQSALKVFMALLSGPESKGLSGGDKKLLALNSSSVFTKKDNAVRRAELLQPTIPVLMQSFMSSVFEMDQMILSKTSSRVFIETLKESVNQLMNETSIDVESTTNSLKKVIEKFIQCVQGDPSLLDHIIGHRVVKEIVVVLSALFPKGENDSGMPSLTVSLCELIPASEDTFQSKCGWIVAAMLENDAVPEKQRKEYLRAAGKVKPSNGCVQLVVALK